MHRKALKRLSIRFIDYYNKFYLMIWSLWGNSNLSVKAQKMREMKTLMLFHVTKYRISKNILEDAE